MKYGMMIGAMVACAALGVQAQEVTKITKESSVKIKDGDDVKVIGCVRRAAGGYALSNLSGNSDRIPHFRLVFDKDSRLEDVDKYVGQKVEIEGEAALSDDAKVEVRTKTKREIEDGPDEHVQTKTEISGDPQPFPLLKVDHVKRVSESCPSGS